MEITPNIRSEAMMMGMEFGEDWLEKVGPRILKLYPDLKQEQLQELDEQVVEIRKWGMDFLQSRAGWGNYGQDEFAELRYSFHADFLTAFPWAKDDIALRVFSQSCYYSMK